MKKLFFLSLILVSSYTYAQNDSTTTAPSDSTRTVATPAKTATPNFCWGSKINLDMEYVFKNDDVTEDLKTSYTAKEIKGIYENIVMHDRTIWIDLDNQQYMCSLLWPFFTFIMNGTYDKKELAEAGGAFLSAFGTKDFITDLNNVDFGLSIAKMLRAKVPVLEGFNGKDKPNDYPDDYAKFSSQPNNTIVVDLMNSNENFFLSLKTFLKEKGTSLKNITVDDLFNLLVYLNDKNYLDMEYFSRTEPSYLKEVSYFDKVNKHKNKDGIEETYYDTYAGTVLTELKKIKN
jgi:hypothetical protein